MVLANGVETAMSLEVVMPVCGQVEYTAKVFDSMAMNTVIPNRILLINNGTDKETAEVVEEYAGYLPIEHLQMGRNIGVNAAWNLGARKADAEIISILNNDLVLTPWFFEKVIRTFVDHPRCGCALPNTIGLKPVETYLDHGRNRVSVALYREGWAFSMRRVIYDAKGPIPETLCTFYGDDFLFAAAKEMGFTWLRMLDNPVHHFESRTLYATGGGEKFPEDQEQWNTLKAETAGILSYDELPMHVDMSPYAGFYRQIIERALVVHGDKANRALIVEAGSRYGCSARIILEAVAPDQHSQLVLLDPQTNQFLQQIVDGNKVIHRRTTCEKAAQGFKNESILVLHIDVDPHEYEQTKVIFNLYARKVRRGGCVIFHDCTDFFGVKQFVTEKAADPAWVVVYCKPKPETILSAPAALWKV